MTLLEKIVVRSSSCGSIDPPTFLHVAVKLSKLCEVTTHGSDAPLSLKNLGAVDKLIGPEADSGDVYEAEITC